MYCFSSAAARPPDLGQIGRNPVSRPAVGLHEIDLDGFHLLQELLVHDVGNSALVENLVVFFRLIQSHAQGGPRSAALGENDPDGRDLLPVCEMLLDHFAGFF